MTKTNAERQVEYRARQQELGNMGDQRLNTMIDLSATYGLERLAKCYGVTKKAMLERLIWDAESNALEIAAKKTNGVSRYYGGTLKLKLQDKDTFVPRRLAYIIQLI